MIRDRAATAAAICEAISLGSSLRKACEAQGITHAAYLQWIDGNEVLTNQYARARELGWALLADEVITISDEVEFEPVPGDDPDAESHEVRVDATAIARNRLRVDSRKWMLSKMLPKAFGDKQHIEHSGEIGIADRLKRAEERRK